jgi:hypothetical protein
VFEGHASQLPKRFIGIDSQHSLARSLNIVSSLMQKVKGRPDLFPEDGHAARLKIPHPVKELFITLNSL